MVSKVVVLWCTLVTTITPRKQEAVSAQQHVVLCRDTDVDSRRCSWI